MIKKIKTINNFAVFKTFNWDSDVRDNGNNIAEFKKLNLIYGRNYSGKTTLSRIIRCLETKSLHSHYQDCLFEITDNQSVINHNCLSDHQFEVRVYNSDFVYDNLSFLKNEIGEITPFAILGEQNIEIEKKIEEKEATLGSEEKKTGLRFNLHIKNEELIKKQKDKTNEETFLETTLREKAKRIKEANNIYGDINYDITKIRREIESAINQSYQEIPNDKVEQKKALLREDAKTTIPAISTISSRFTELLIHASDLLQQQIKPTESIQELLHNSILQEWVRNGVDFHKNKRTTCAFCGGIISDDLWNKLDAHFSKESEELRIKIKDIIRELEKEKLKYDDLIKLQSTSFYSVFKNDFEKLCHEMKSHIEICNKSISTLIESLNKREHDIFTIVTIPNVTDDIGTINSTIEQINILIDNNNNQTSSLNSEQSQIKIDLRKNEILLFINQIGYQSIQNKINSLKDDENILKNEYESINIQIQQTNKEIDELRIQLNDERKGANKINSYLNHFFGTDSIKFDAVEDSVSAGYIFKIMRGDQIAYKLSEGECSLVAFCYFMAKLEDTETINKDIIIWIDDPISSLDNNHVFFVFSLIESVITKPYKKSDHSNGYKYKQLFISTHNIDFLKYLKKLSKPKNNKKEDVGYFLLERHGQESRLSVMPDYLQKYSTEFNYLFHQIYKCSLADSCSSSFDIYYNFGNNLRKFLEAYLFYKYPSNIDIIVKLKRFFKDDTSVALANRVDNELSHLEEIFDRSMKPIEIPEIPKLANYVLNKIKEKDPDQYDALIKSIGEAGVN